MLFLVINNAVVAHCIVSFDIVSENLIWIHVCLITVVDILDTFSARPYLCLVPTTRAMLIVQHCLLFLHSICEVSMYLFTKFLTEYRHFSESGLRCGRNTNTLRMYIYIYILYIYNF